MSEQWERSIQEWYTTSRTSNLEYLDLTETKPGVKELAHNISVTCDRICLSCRVHLKHFNRIHEELVEVKREIVTFKQREEQILKLVEETKRDLDEIRVLIKKLEAFAS